MADSKLETLLEWHLKANHIEGWLREYTFVRPRRWRFDFAWPEQMLAVEIEGGTWVNGAHNRGKRFESDCRKYNEATLTGWRVLRFTGAMVKKGEAFEAIERALSDGRDIGE